MKPFGKYQLVRRIAAGGMAEVYLATGPNPRNDELVALKLILPHIAEDESFMAMFLQEARLSAPLIHPNLVQVFDLGMTDGRLYLAMEYIPGRSLNEVMERARAADRPLSVPLAAAAVRQASLGLHHAHEARDAQGRDLGLIHRDVSPHNLMLDEGGTIKVVDFGVAKATSQSEVSRAGTLKGKVGFMSPEQLKSKPLDRRVDIFALGVVLYELATGRALFSGRNDAEVLQRMLFEAPPDMTRQGLPPPVASIIAKAIDRDRSKRYPTAQELANALADYLGPQLPGTAKQLSAVMRSLFPRAPRTVAEAEAEISASGRKAPAGNQVLVSREERRKESTPTDPEQLSSRKRDPSLSRDRPSLPPSRPGDRSGSRPPLSTGATDPRQAGPVNHDELPTRGEGFDVASLTSQLSDEGDLDEATSVARPSRSGPVARPPVEDEEDRTVSTVSDVERPIDRAPGRRARLAIGVAVVGVVVLGLCALLWKVLAVHADPDPLPRLVSPSALDAGFAERIAPSLDAGTGLAGVPAAALDAGPPPDDGTAPHGFLSVSLRAGYRVSVDGREVGMTPLQNYALPVGRHKLLVTDGRHSAHAEVAIRAGATEEPRLRLR